ncbi:MAG: major facilitator superfamily domain-containing protein [Benniella sp.]|nr:MAG: major facilitator superfamily domain-containing protein [Benniella sp.]
MLVNTGKKAPKWAILVVFCLAQFLDVANLSAVNISLPTIKTELHFSESQLPWIVNAFTLTFGTFLLIGGKLGDKYGHKRLFLAGLVWFSIWSLICGLAHSVILLCIARAMQGLGAAATIPNALALIQFTYTEEVAKSKALSVFSSSGALGFGIGLVLGGVFTATIGWKYIFYISAIMGVCVAAVAYFIIPESDAAYRANVKLDLAGAITITAALLALVYAISDGGWATVQVIVCLVASVLLLVLFVWIENKVESPMLPMSIFRTRMFTAMLIVGALYQTWYLVYNLYCTLIFQEIMNYSALSTAYAFFPLAFPGLILNPMAGYLIPKVGAKPLLVIGTGCMALSAALFAIADADTGYWPLPFPSMCIGEIGIALTYTSAMVAALTMAKSEEHGLNSAVFSVAMQAGSGVGLAITNAISDAVIQSTGSHLKGYQVGLWIGFAVTLLCVLITLVFVPSKAALERKRHAKTGVTNRRTPEDETADLGSLDSFDPESGGMASPGCSGVAGAEKAELDEVVEAKKDEVQVLGSSV